MRRVPKVCFEGELSTEPESIKDSESRNMGQEVKETEESSFDLTKPKHRRRYTRAMWLRHPSSL